MGPCSSRPRLRLNDNLLSTADFSSKYIKKVTRGDGKRGNLVLGQGSFGKVVLVEERATRSVMRALWSIILDLLHLTGAVCEVDEERTARVERDGNEAQLNLMRRERLESRETVIRRSS